MIGPLGGEALPRWVEGSPENRTRHNAVVGQLPEHALISWPSWHSLPILTLMTIRRLLKPGRNGHE